MEKKVLFLADLKKVPETQMDVIRWLDILYDIRKLNKMGYDRCDDLEKTLLSDSRGSYSRSASKLFGLSSTKGD